MTDFERFAIGHAGINSSALHRFVNENASPNPVLSGRGEDIYSRLLMDRIIWLGVPIDDTVANIVQAELLYLASISDADIQIYLNSPGGVVSAGLGIYDAMQFVPCHVGTVCTGVAASMAAVLFCAGEKGDRGILPHSRVMLHQPLGAIQGQASDLIIEAREAEKLKNELATIVSTHSGQPLEKVIADTDRNFWLSAEEAVAYGLADLVLTGP